MTEPAPMSMCPMAEIRKGMLVKPLSAFVVVVPVLILIVLGVVVLIEPRILLWLVAFIALICDGHFMLALAKFVRKVWERFQITKR
ncbi:MAG: hypothetical protein HKN83_07695 [Gammaproteobacteria bacterium]|nr:hypothetical protein [Gammaproteobacteria bacterium]